MSFEIDSALAKLQGLFIEPAVAERAHPPAGLESRPIVRTRLANVEVAVVGLSGGCGASTVAFGLALALAAPGRRSHLLLLGPAPARPGPGVQVWEVPAALREPREIGEYGGVVARLAGSGTHLAQPLAVVWDVPAGDAERGGEVARAADVVVAVAPGDGEPALGGLAAEMLSDRYGRVLLVANRVPDRDTWLGYAGICLPDSRIAARRLARGRRPGYALGARLSELATLVEMSVG